MKIIPSVPELAADENGDIWRIVPYEYHAHKHLPFPFKYCRGKNSQGYCVVKPSINGVQYAYMAHRLVCEAFHGPAPAGHDAAHWDGDRGNNKPANLRWATRKENMADAIRHRSIRSGKNHPNTKLDDRKISIILEMRKYKFAQRSIAFIVGIGQASVSRVLNNQHWPAGRG